MQNTDFQTVTVQPIGSTTPTTLAKAATVPLRVEVNNVGPVVIFVGASVTDLAPRPTTATYRVFPGETHVFVLAPREGAYAVGAATGGLMSVTSSEALPRDF
jgi:hypothetical protein